MSSVLTGDLMTGFTGGNAWGLGVCLVREPQGVTASLSPGSFGHGGAFGTQAWIDPTKGSIYLLMVQRANFPNADNSELRKALQEEGSKALAARAARVGLPSLPYAECSAGTRLWGLQAQQGRGEHGNK